MIPVTQYIESGLFAKLSPSEAKLLAVLTWHCNKRSRLSWPTQDTLARETGLTTRSVRSALRGLKNYGIIEIQPRYDNPRCVSKDCSKYQYYFPLPGESKDKGRGNL